MRIYGRIFLLLSASFAMKAALAAPVPVDRPGLSDPALGPGQRIRVRLDEGASVARLRGFDLQIFDSLGVPKPFGRGVASFDRTTEWEFRCQGNRVRALRTGSAQSLELRSPVSIRTPVGFLHFHARPYREELQIHAVGSLCEVVNTVDLEKYLDGLVNAEFSSRWAESAIAAQVVAARTYALHQMGLARAQHYDVDATVKDQVYDGSIREDFRASRSVARTRGLVLTTGPARKPVPLKAFYHSTCGGRTELPEAVWGKPYPGFRRTVACPYCAISPAYRWDTEMGDREVARLIRAGALTDGAPRGWPRDWRRVLDEGRLSGLRVQQVDPSGRVRDVVASWLRAGRTFRLPISGVRLRQWLGYGRFRSATFNIASVPGNGGFRFMGRGNGHGVGMCQYGAKGMGERGFTASAILHHYYPDAVLRRLW